MRHAVFVVVATAALGCWPPLDQLSGGSETTTSTDAGPSEGAAGGAAYRDAVLADGPAAYWRLGERSGPDARDESGHGHAAAYQGAVVFGAPGASSAVDADTAVSLDGSTASVRIGTDLDISDRTTFKEGFTIEAWIAPTVFAGNFRRILSKEDLTGGPRNGYNVYVDPSSAKIWFFRFVAGAAVDEASSSVPVPMGAYTHVVVTFSEATQTTSIYLNGSLSGSAQHSGAAAAPTSFVGYWGRASIDDGDSNFAGSLDEVALYTKPLDTARIVAHYEASGRRR
jgi:hypothetical protein